MSTNPTPVEKGRAVMAALVAAVITSEVFSLAIDQGKITTAVCVRITIEAILLFAAWRGFAWARWTLAFFYVLGSAAAVTFAVKQINPALIAFCVYYIGMTAILILASSIAAFQKSQREKPNQSLEPTTMAVTPPAAQEPRQP